jgi:hypothetical protein
VGPWGQQFSHKPARRPELPSLRGGRRGQPVRLLIAAKVAAILGGNDDSTVWSQIALAPSFFGSSPITARTTPSIERDAQFSPA